MGVSYAHFIIPRSNDLRPEPTQIASLVTAWEAAGIVSTENATVQTEQTQAAYFQALERHHAETKRRPIWSWFLSSAGRKSWPGARDFGKPFTVPLNETSYAALSNSEALVRLKTQARGIFPDTPKHEAERPELALHLTDDFSDMNLSDHAPIPLTTLCSCGVDLKRVEENLVYGFKVKRICPNCGVQFRPQDHVVEVMNGATGALHSLRGGLCYRFAIIIECGKRWPSEDATSDPRVNRKFMEICESTLGLELQEVSYYS